ncbi:bifunctional hydroxymethylpyrimidine kinase/phosphomethylpyrimidine kinase [Parabacteroides bouchesdurhonensis]|uniref:bifunctional hydroxymethylpyrimidine kinase/phosphomethylpyrimidine kinase n=1 Tax=Parabacteroides bouchesdurhonensis TaxID=1936995 RepID=UPI000C816CA8|nr:bifunctional hydroxymethylpyrimidine kinase/phosphomethylpyrimidine kinase [Parabacteroides bouchesdurhonensis]
MDENNTFRYPIALTIAGSDSGGGAGIQADLKTFSALGVFGMSVITAVTAQNTQNVYGIQAISSSLVKEQINAVFNDFTIDAVKTGMLPNKEAVQAVVEAIAAYSPSCIISDPVMISSSGKKLMEDEAIDILMKDLFPKVTLITPNIDEATCLSGITICNEKDMERAARQLQKTVGCSVLIKGGHLTGQASTDILFIPDRPPLRLEAPVIHTRNTHGTGCTLSSAIAAYMALGNDLQKAVCLAKEYITKALSAGTDMLMGHGHGAMNHFFSPIPLTKIKIRQ